MPKLIIEQMRRPFPDPRNSGTAMCSKLIAKIKTAATGEQTLMAAPGNDPFLSPMGFEKDALQDTTLMGSRRSTQDSLPRKCVDDGATKTALYHHPSHHLVTTLNRE